MGLFSRQRTVTAVLFAHELSVYALEYAQRGQGKLAYALGLEITVRRDPPVPRRCAIIEHRRGQEDCRGCWQPELIVFHLWAAYSALNSLNEWTATCVREAMEKGFVEPAGQMGWTADQALDFYTTRIVEYTDAFNNHAGLGPMFHLIKQFSLNITGKSSAISMVLANEPSGWLNMTSSVNQYVNSYMKSLSKFTRKYRVTVGS